MPRLRRDHSLRDDRESYPALRYCRSTCVRAMLVAARLLLADESLATMLVVWRCCICLYDSRLVFTLSRSWVDGVKHEELKAGFFCEK